MEFQVHAHRMEDDPKWLDAMRQRKCKKCGKVKPHSHMKKDKRLSFGIQRICKDCDNVVWPKHLKYRQARTAKTNAKAQVARQAVTGKSNVPAGLTPHPQMKEILEKDLPAGILPASPDESLPVNLPDPSALLEAQEAIPSPTVSHEDRFISDLAKIGPVVDAQKPCVEFQKAIAEKVTESLEQSVLRAKMERDGFDKGMIEGAVRMLPRILKDLKELREEGII